MEPDTEKSTLDSSENIETTNRVPITTNTSENKTSEDVSEEISKDSPKETELDEVNNSKTLEDSTRNESSTIESTTKDSITGDSIPKSKLEDEIVSDEKFSDEKHMEEEDLKTNGSVTEDEALNPNKDDNIEKSTSENIVKEETEETKKEPQPSEYPEFAVIQSFLTMFGVELDLPIVSLVDLDNVFSPNYRLSIDKGTLYKYLI